MKNKALALASLILALLFVMVGCSAPAAAPTVAPTVAATAAPTPAPTASPAPTPEPTGAPTQAAALGFADSSTVAAFKLFNLVKLGMTKTEVNKALGVEGKSNNDEDAKNNTFDYLDDQACGVKVAFSADNKAYSRMIIYNDPASTFGTLSAKPVTEDQYHQIDPGMAYSEVVALLGGPAIVTKEAADQKDCASNIIRTVDWGNADGSYIELTLNSDGTVNEASYQDYQPE